jgi:hypothetical protein
VVVVALGAGAPDVFVPGPVVDAPQASRAVRAAAPAAPANT